MPTAARLAAMTEGQREATRGAARRYYLNNREAAIERAARWRATNPEKVRAMNRARNSRRADRLALFGARRNHGVTDEAEYLRIWHEPCCSCGEPAGGVDRIDSTGSYAPGNMQPLCTMCNYAKNKKPQAEFDYWRAQLVRHWLYQNNLKATPKE